MLEKKYTESWYLVFEINHHHEGNEVFNHCILKNTVLTKNGEKS
jgi:hypothetical protein